MKAHHKSGVDSFIARVRREARQRREAVTLRTMGRERVFVAYDWGCDTFIFEKDVWRRLENHSPVLVARKGDLSKGTSGYILTLTTGNHTVAAIPLMSGQFWSLGRVPAARRSRVFQSGVVCANVVEGRIEISQREVPTAVVTAADEWFQSVGFALDEVIMAERNNAALEYYRQQGQEWRIKPLAWTRREMEAALAASRTRINTGLRYYHSAKGVHFLTYAEFHGLLARAAGDYAGFVDCLRELVAVFEGDARSCMRTPKYSGHNEIELFGLLRGGTACGRIVPELEGLLEGVASGRFAAPAAVERLRAIDALFKASLDRPGLADERSDDFIETLYMHLTGEVYDHAGAVSVSPTFDDRRTALPGATFRGGRPDFHPGVDDRTRVLLANVEQLMSQDETLVYANIYEVRSEGDGADKLALGAGDTREVVFKTDRRPLCTGLIAKRLAQTAPSYGSYMLARVEAVKALGVGFGEYRLLMRLPSAEGRAMNYFIRNRCPGEPLDDIPAHMFQRVGGGGEDPEVVLKLGALLGDAAAQNLVLKKYLPNPASCRFGMGKEVFEFGYDISARREMPMSVMLCSIRGSFGWPDTSYTDANLDTLFDFYFGCYAQVLCRYWRRHREAVPLEHLAERFFDGFEFKTREMHWNYSVRREQFDAFDPRLPRHFAFVKKWRFALWSLERQLRDIERLRTAFAEKVRQTAGAAAEGEGPET